MLASGAGSGPGGARGVSSRPKRVSGANGSQPVKIVPLEEHVLLVFWVQLLVLVVTARLLGVAARRFGQPAVIGELAAGVLLGPSVFGALFPGAAGWLFPADAVSGGLLQVAGWLGIVLLLVLTGFET